MKLFLLSFVMLLISALSAPAEEGAEVLVRVENPPQHGTVIAMLFGSADSFVSLRDPLIALPLPSDPASPGRISQLTEGEYALVVYHDLNGNGVLDKNFIGIPSEPLGFSNRYWPKGPPTFSSAAFKLKGGETKEFDVKLQSVFGKSGIVNLGVGGVYRTSPYRDAKGSHLQPIPAISYIGDRLQILGLTALYGLLRRDDYSLAATSSFRFGAYSESDSPYLQGMGSRQGTLFGGLALHFKLPEGLKLSAGYEHDLLGRSGGGIGRIGIDRSFQQKALTLSPHIALNWISAAQADYDYGVTTAQARAGRPAYHPGDAVNLEGGVTLFRELARDWQLILSGKVTFLPANITESPIVSRSQEFSSFLAVTRQF